jgi:16S rRNA (guanine527-N7)-methyltransferase
MTAADLSRIGVSREIESRLDRHVALARQWHHSINLISASSAAEMLTRHVLDSLQLRAFMPPGAAMALDIGSGAGFPGLVLAISTGVSFTLVEADKRKAAFLREAVRVTDAPARVIAQRVETVTESADVVTARAVADLRTLLTWSYPLLRPRGTCLFLKGERIEKELRDAEDGWSMEAVVHRSITRTGSCVVEIRDLRPNRDGIGGR